MNYDAIIFDMDGTITDTEHIWHKANLLLLEKRGIVCPPKLDDSIRKKTHGMRDAKRCLLLKTIFDLSDSLDDLIIENRACAYDAYKTHVAFMNGFCDFFTQLQQHNIKTAIATNANDTIIEITSNALNLRQFFGPHIYGRHHVNDVWKPAPDVYQFAAKQLDVDPKRCIAIEDSASGITAALDAGMFCIGINNKPDFIHNANLQTTHFTEIDLQTLLYSQD